MKKLIFAWMLPVVLLSVNTLRAQAPEAPATPYSFSSDEERFAYYFGIALADLILDEFLSSEEIKVDWMARGMQDKLEKKTKLTQHDVKDWVEYYMDHIRPEKAEIAAKEIQENWLEEFKYENPDVRQTPNGLLYQIVTPGQQGGWPTDAKGVKFAFKITQFNGEILEEDDDPITVPLRDLPMGIEQGFRLIGPGGEIVMWVHPWMLHNEDWEPTEYDTEILKFEIKLLEVLTTDPDDSDENGTNPDIDIIEVE